jgi:hypothetical protein
VNAWFLRHAEAGTIGPLDIDTVLEGISDGRVPVETAARAAGEHESTPLQDIPVFAMAIRAAKPPPFRPRPFEGLVEENRVRQAQRSEAELREAQAYPPPVDVGPVRRRRALFARRDVSPRVVAVFAVGILLGFGAAAVAFWKPDGAPARAERLASVVDRAVRHVVVAPTPSSSPPPAVPTGTPLSDLPIEPPSREASPSSVASGTARTRPAASPSTPSFEVDSLHAPLTPPLGERPPAPAHPSVPEPGF